MNQGEKRDEWLKFGLLVVLLGLFLLLVALVRPLLAELALRSLLGDGVPASGVPDASRLPRPIPPPPAPTAAPERPAEIEVTPALTGTLSVDDGAGALQPALDSAPTPEDPYPTAVPAIVYFVRPGDTLSRIAAEYGVTVSLLVTVNQLEDPDRLAVGRQLLIPQP